MQKPHAPDCLIRKAGKKCDSTEYCSQCHGTIFNGSIPACSKFPTSWLIMSCIRGDVQSHGGICLYAYSQLTILLMLGI